MKLVNSVGKVAMTGAKEGAILYGASVVNEAAMAVASKFKIPIPSDLLAPVVGILLAAISKPYFKGELAAVPDFLAIYPVFRLIEGFAANPIADAAAKVGLAMPRVDALSTSHGTFRLSARKTEGTFFLNREGHRNENPVQSRTLQTAGMTSTLTGNN